MCGTFVNIYIFPYTKALFACSFYNRNHLRNKDTVDTQRIMMIGQSIRDLLSTATIKDRAGVENPSLPRTCFDFIALQPFYFDRYNNDGYYY